MEINNLICLTIFITVFCTQCQGICVPPCSGNFVCSGSACICNTGFYGTDCTDTCEDSGAASCQNGGTCGASSSRSCSCTSGFTGTLCATESNVVPPVKKHPCSTTTTATTTTTTTPTTTVTSTTVYSTTSQNNTASFTTCLLNPISYIIIFMLLYKVFKYRAPHFV